LSFERAGIRSCLGNGRFWEHQNWGAHAIGTGPVTPGSQIGASMKVEQEVRHKSEDIEDDVLLDAVKASRGDSLVVLSTFHEALREAYRRGKAGEGSSLS
jgi:hypothetical protein